MQIEESLSIHSSRLESLRTQLATKKFLSEEELWVQALMEAEKARQHEMHRLREQIRSLANQDCFPLYLQRGKLIIKRV